MKRAVTYLRRATDRQEQSIQDQRRHLAAYADQNDLIIVDEFVDDAISGTTARDRPAFQRMINQAQSQVRTFDCILVYDVKRFGRIDGDEAGYYRHQLRQHGVEVVYATERLSGTDSDALLLPVLQWNARRESQDLSKVTVRGLLSVVEGGWWMGGVPPYGYDLMYYDAAGSPLHRVRYAASGDRHVYRTDGSVERVIPAGERLVRSKRDRARLTPGDEEEVRVVGEIFTSYVQRDFGFKKIARTLNEQGVPAPRRGRWARMAGRLWTQSSVRNILANRAYVGDSVWNRRTEGKFHRISDGRAVPRQAMKKVELNDRDDWIVHSDTHQALVDRELFSRVQKLMGRNRRVNRATGRGAVSPYLLSGLLVCTRCSSRIHGRKAVSGRKKNRSRITTYSYVCGGYVRSGPSVCPSAAISKDTLEQAVVTSLSRRVQLLADEHFRDQLQEEIQRLVNSKAHGLPEKLQAVNDEIQAEKDRATLLARHVSPENVQLLDQSLTEIRRKLEQLEERAHALESELLRSRVSVVDADEIIRTLDQRLNRFERLFAKGTLAEQREFLRLLLQRVEVDPVERAGTAYWYRLDDVALGQTQPHLLRNIGATGFEPATSCSQSRRSARLSYAPEGRANRARPFLARHSRPALPPCQYLGRS